MFSAHLNDIHLRHCNVPLYLFYLDLIGSDIIINIAFSSIPTAGDHLNLTCSATVPERLVKRHRPTFILISYQFGGVQEVAEVNPNAKQYEVIRTDNVFSSIVTINPVKTSDAREYHCEVVFGSPFNVDPDKSRILSVHSKSLHVKKSFLCSFFSFVVPPPSMSISLTPSGTIYESTLLVITCNATLPSVVDTDVTATVTWTGPSGTVISSDGRVAVGQDLLIDEGVFQSNVTFSPVDNGDMNDQTNDTGEYTCDATISSTNQLILSGTNNITDEITVDSMFYYYILLKQ